jgi:hypothetical protein
MDNQSSGQKTCSICKETKPLDVFETDKRRPDGHGPRCKPCIKAKASVRKDAGEKPASTPEVSHSTAESSPDIKAQDDDIVVDGSHGRANKNDPQDKFGCWKEGYDSCGSCGCREGRHYHRNTEGKMVCAGGPDGCPGYCTGFVLSDESKAKREKAGVA